jgi:hypothetical protein
MPSPFPSYFLRVPLQIVLIYIHALFISLALGSAYERKHVIFVLSLAYPTQCDDLQFHFSANDIILVFFIAEKYSIVGINQIFLSVHQLMGT